MQINPIPILNSYWVIPGRFRAGEHPGVNSNPEARRKLIWLMQKGTNTIIDLSGTLGNGIDYSACIAETATLLHCRVDYLPLPINDFSTPSSEKMIAILDTIDQAILNDKNIYLHCLMGMGRTGLVVGCYLARHAITGLAALQKIQELRMGTPTNNSRSPETDAQRRMVIEWRMRQ